MASTTARHVDALRAQARALDALADAMEAAAADGGRSDDLGHGPGAFGADAAAQYVGIGPTLLRESGPPPRYVGGRAIWLRDDLDAWLAQLPTERSHGRGRRPSGTTGRVAL